MTEDVFIKGMAILREAFSNRVINAKVFFQALEDLTDEDFLNAVLKIVRGTTKMYPDDNLIAMIREKVYGPVKDRACIAWTEARHAIISVGAYRSVSFKDKVINGVIQGMGGWEKFCLMQIDEEPFRQKDFISLYSAISEAKRNCPERLIGYTERTNGKPEKTVLIGERKNLEADMPRVLEKQI